MNWEKITQPLFSPRLESTQDEQLLSRNYLKIFELKKRIISNKVHRIETIKMTDVLLWNYVQI